VFAAMKLPYIVNVFAWKFWDKYSKKLLISIILVLMSFLFMALWFSENFYAILVLTFFISTWVALLSPLTSALVVSYTHPQDKWSMMWVQDFMWRAWDIAWSLWFWTLTAIIWLQKGFTIIWFCTLWLWWYLLIKKLLSFRSKNNEREKVKSNEVYELPIPVVDAVREESINKK
jgi:archaellum biogenesis protein FlaJ (TadC family)